MMHPWKCIEEFRATSMLALVVVASASAIVAQQPRFACWPEFFGDLASISVPIVTDLDVNGIPDLVRPVSSNISYPGLYLGLGDGRFLELPVSLPPWQSGGFASPGSSRPGFGDVDGDGLPDFLLSFRFAMPAPNDYPMYLLLNQGAGRFAYDQSGRLPPVRVATTGGVFGDIEPDGDLDIYVGNWQGADVLLVNDGTGHFTDESAARLPSLSLVTSTSHVAFGDVTGDGLPDIVRAGFNTTNLVLVNTGFGVFTPGQVLGAGRFEDVDLVDVDSDGDLDVYFSSDHTGDRLWSNQGGGAFVEQSAARGIRYFSESATFADYDEDGDVDAVLADTDSQFVEGAMRTIGPVVLQNDGSGLFTNIAGSAVTGNWSLAWGTLVFATAAPADFDNDGDIDFVLSFGTILFGNQKETVTMFNLKRHIRCEPQVARGGVAQVELYADAGHIVAPVLSFAPASTSLGDLGRLMIDPTSTIPLPIAFFASQGRIDRPVPIPNAPAFAGWIVYSQGIDLWDEAGVPKAHLTNVTQFRIQ